MKPVGTDDGGKELPPELQHTSTKSPNTNAAERTSGRKRRGWIYLLRMAGIMLACSIPVGLLLGWLIQRFGVAERYGNMLFIVLGICGLGFITFSLYRILRGDPDV